MTRLDNWQTTLSDYIVSCAHKPFQYGVLDCGLFVADAIKAMTGKDVAGELRGLYTTRGTAFMAIKALCGRTSMEAGAAYLAGQSGVPEVPVLMAQRGDPILLRHGASSSLGIVDMSPGYLLTPYRNGLLRLPLTLATRAYHIG